MRKNLHPNVKKSFKQAATRAQMIFKEVTVNGGKSDIGDCVLLNDKTIIVGNKTTEEEIKEL